MNLVYFLFEDRLLDLLAIAMVVIYYALVGVFFKTFNRITKRMCRWNFVIGLLLSALFLVVWFLMMAFPFGVIDSLVRDEAELMSEGGGFVRYMTFVVVYIISMIPGFKLMEEKGSSTAPY